MAAPLDQSRSYQPTSEDEPDSTQRTLSQTRPIPTIISPHDIIIPVMGITGSGKSTFISLCTDEHVGICHDLFSYTAEVRVYSLTYRGYVIRLIDTPGFDDSKRPDVEILSDIAYWLSRAYAAEPKLLLSGIVYLHPIHEPRMQGTAKKNLNMFRLLCGNESLKCVVLATTMWSKVSETEGKNRQEELVATERFWGHMVRHGSQVFKHENIAASAFAIIDHIIDNRRPVVLDIQKEMVEEQKDVDETNAGKAQREAELKAKEKAERRLQESEDELKAALETEERANVERLLEDQKNYKKEIEDKEKNLQSMKINMDELREKQEAQAMKEARRMEDATKAQDAKISQMATNIEELKKAHDEAVKKAETQEQTKIELEKQSLALIQRRDQDAMVEHRQWQLAETNRQIEVARLAEISRQIEAARLASQLEVMNLRSQISSLTQQQMAYQGRLASQLEIMNLRSQNSSLTQQLMAYQGRSQEMNVADKIQVGAAAGTGIAYGALAMAVMCTIM